MRFFSSILPTVLLMALPQAVMAAGDHVSPKALDLFSSPFFTNSSFMAIIACVLISVFVLKAMRPKALVPSGKQNFVELVVEFLYGQVEGIVGKKVAPKAFPLLGSIFIFVLVSNYMGLVPGVGTFGVVTNEGEMVTPFFRPSTADVNMTLGIAVISMVVWAIITYQEIGIWGFLVHTFGPKGGLKGFMKYPVAVIFFVVGIIEIVSIIFRPVSLGFRLYGNIFAGESLLHTMSAMADKVNPFARMLLDVLLPLPFYFMELLVGLLQAMVFTLLVAVYIQLTTTHEEHGEHDHEEGHDHGHAAPAPH